MNRVRDDRPRRTRRTTPAALLQQNTWLSPLARVVTTAVSRPWYRKDRPLPAFAEPAKDLLKAIGVPLPFAEAVGSFSRQFIYRLETFPGMIKGIPRPGLPSACRA